MFCPKCGKADQSPDTYCRQCGIFLPDLSKPVKQKDSPETHVTANLVLSGMTIVASFTLAILLYAILAFRPQTHPLIYVTAGLLLAMGIWHTQTFYRSYQLRKHFKRMNRSQRSVFDAAPDSDKLLDKPDFESVVPASVTDRTTKHLNVPR